MFVIVAEQRLIAQRIRWAFFMFKIRYWRLPFPYYISAQAVTVMTFSKVGNGSRFFCLNKC